MAESWPRTGLQGRRFTRAFVLEVAIMSGPVAPEFAKRHPAVIRTIHIREDQTLADLHRAIFKAFNRFEEHSYEFQFGDGPHDPAAKRYVLPSVFEHGDVGRNKPAGSVDSTTIGSLGLTYGKTFGYWFDFGDDWYHLVRVATMGRASKKYRYPRVTKRIGPSPPQYADSDEGE